MIGDLEGRVALICGAAAGMGRAIAESFNEAGAELGLMDFDEEGLNSLADGMEGGPELIIGNATLSDDARSAVERTAQRFGDLHILVNVVGGSGHDNRVPEMSEREWNAIIAQNLTSVYMMAHWAIPQIVRSGGGSIVNISSGAGITGGYMMPAYAAAKAGVIGLTRALAVDHGADGIRVNCVAPGPIRTPGMTTRRTEAEMEGMGPGVILGRIGEPSEIASAVLYLASEGASYITGQVLEVNGGQGRGRAPGKDTAKVTANAEKDPDIVATIESLRAEGLSLRAIAARLDASGRHPSFGSNWEPQGVARALGLST